MGLGIYIRASYEGDEDNCRALLRAFFEKEQPPVPGRTVSILEYGSTFRAGLFFAEEDVYCGFEEPGFITIGGRTSGAGPGYHAHLADMLCRMQAACGLSWSPDDVEDESGYWHSRDFGDIQESMAHWLGSLAAHLVENLMDESISGLALSMPTDGVPDNDAHYAAHLLGWRERDFFRILVEQGISEEDCAGFFIWWNKEADGDFYRKCALSMLWCGCNWLPPYTLAEKHDCSSILFCLEKAWDENPRMTYPVREWKEVAALSGSTDIVHELERRFPDEIPESGRIGFRRGNVFREIGDGWRMSMPGAMHEAPDEKDPNIDIYWDADRAIRVSRFTVTGPSASAESLLETLTNKEENAYPLVLRNQGKVLAKICHESLVENDGTEYYGTFFFAAVTGRALYASAFYNDPKDRAWAESMFASITWQEA